MKKTASFIIYFIILAMLTGCAHQLKAPKTPTSSLLIGYIDVYMPQSMGPITRGTYKNFNMDMIDGNGKSHKLRVKNGYFLIENIEPGKCSFKKVNLSKSDVRSYSAEEAFIEFFFNYDFIVKSKCIAYLGHFTLTPDMDNNKFNIDHNYDELNIREYIKETTEDFKKSKGKESEWNTYQFENL